MIHDLRFTIWKRSLAALLILIIGSSVTFSQTTPVLFSSASLTGTINNRRILVTADQTPWPPVSGTNLLANLQFYLQPVNGQVTTNLVPWGYTIQVDGWPRSIHVWVPASTNVINVVSLINTNAFAPLNLYSGSITINSYGSGGTSDYNALSNTPPNIVTNGQPVVQIGADGGSGVRLHANGGTLSVSNSLDNAPADILAGSFRGLFVGNGSSLSNLPPPVIILTNLPVGTLPPTNLTTTFWPTNRTALMDRTNGVAVGASINGGFISSGVTNSAITTTPGTNMVTGLLDVSHGTAVGVVTNLAKITPTQFGAVGDGITDDSAALIAMAKYWSTTAVPTSVDLMGKIYLYGTNVPMVFSNRSDLYQFDGPEFSHGTILSTNQANLLTLAICCDYARIHDFQLYGPNTNNYNNGGTNSVGIFVGRWPSYASSSYVQNPSLINVRVQNFGTNIVATHWVGGEIKGCQILCAGLVNLYFCGDESVIHFSSIGFDNNSGTPVYGIPEGPQNGATVASNTVAIYLAASGLGTEVSKCDLNDVGQILHDVSANVYLYQNNSEVGWGVNPSLYFSNVLVAEVKQCNINPYFNSIGTTNKSSTYFTNANGTGNYILSYNSFTGASADGSIQATNEFWGAGCKPNRIETFYNQPINVMVQGNSINTWYPEHPYGEFFQNVSGAGPGDLIEIGNDSYSGTYPEIYNYAGVLNIRMSTSHGFNVQGSGGNILSSDYYGNVSAAGAVAATGNETAGGHMTAVNGFWENIRSTNATFNASYADSVLICSGTITATLPTAVGYAGKTFVIKNSGTGTVTVGTTSSQNIDGATTKALPTQYDSIKVISDGTQWWITSEFGTGLTL